MYRFIFQQWRNRKVTILLIISGFFVGSFVMSLGTSASVESLEYISDQQRGNPEHQLDISLSGDGDWKQQDMEKIVEKISEYGEVQILSMGNQYIAQYENNYPIVPVLFEEEPNWHIPLIEGKYFSIKDMKENKSVIIGNSIAMEQNIELGDKLVIDTNEFNVIGIGGRSSRETSWEHAIYMSWANYVEIYEDSLFSTNGLHAVTIHLESGKEKFIEGSDKLIEEADQKGITIFYENISDVDASSFKNSLIVTIIATVLVFTIAIINIIHLMLYWLVERKREIGIMKALGANNGYIAKTVLFEIIVIAIVGCLLAIIVQYLAMFLFAETPISKEITFRVTWLNLIYTMGVSLFFGVIAAIVPVLNAMRMEPINAINRT